MEAGGDSTLVLIGDREFELRVSSARVRFSSWATLPPAELVAGLSLSLVARDSAAEEAPAALLPAVLTPPSTARFQLSAAADEPAASAATGPLMPLLSAGHPVQYAVAFVPPSTAESDFAWDDFQDQVVVHSKLGRLVVALHATKRLPQCEHAAGADSRAFHPRTLPTVRAPALKLFDYIARTNADAPALHRSHVRVSESFNGARRTPSSALEPLPPLITAETERPSSPGSGRRAATPAQAAATEISSLKEARAVISQLRAQHAASHRSAATGAGSSSAASSATAAKGARTVVELAPAEDAGPEALAQAAKRELDAFNCVVAAAKQRAASECAAARSELCFYEQLLPRAAAAKPSTPPLCAALRPSSSSSSSSSSSGSLTALEAGKKHPPKAQRLATKRVTGKLPSLSADGGARTLENNQELSPRTSGSLAVGKAAPARKRTPPTARRPPGASRQQQSAAGAPNGAPVAPNAALSGRSAAGRPPSAAKQPGKRPGHGPERPKGSERARRRPQDEGEQLSDFDDADPEVDEAPQLPEERTGVAALEHDSELDEEDARTGSLY